MGGRDSPAEMDEFLHQGLGEICSHHGIEPDLDHQGVARGRHFNPEKSGNPNRLARIWA